MLESLRLRINAEARKNNDYGGRRERRTEGRLAEEEEDGLIFIIFFNKKEKLTFHAKVQTGCAAWQLSCGCLTEAVVSIVAASVLLPHHRFFSVVLALCFTDHAPSFTLATINSVLHGTLSSGIVMSMRRSSRYISLIITETFEIL
ncbi:hypothetical protein Nepgr_016524 [Nepenthes gracilis]|uniref:Uncharacterized protein n=1 Tax=Nepenthes gracilis TaxID=150966 RepID=A0AAD3XRP9_NEPGR|nr:hypothetical protein Nepgr_016524 [Nepenthes gracilis]